MQAHHLLVRKYDTSGVPVLLYSELNGHDNLINHIERMIKFHIPITKFQIEFFLVQAIVYRLESAPCVTGYAALLLLKQTGCYRCR